MSDAIAVGERCARIALLVVDVDGVLTDGSIVYSDRGDEIKTFHVRDGPGLKLWMALGKKSAILSGRKSAIVERRAKELGVSTLIQGMDNKLVGWDQLLELHQVRPEETAFIGDDLLDLPVLKRAGLAVAVADACPEVRVSAHYVTATPGGRGAVREVIEMILQAQGHWTDAVARFAV